MAHILTIKAIENLTPDVLRIVTTKPKRISYKPGQAVDLSINQPDWKDELRAFTFTSLEEDNNLEFTIKTYSERNGMTHELTKLKAGDELIIQHPFGSITYKGPGVFIAGGSGITPFLAIFKMLERNRAIGENKLIFGNRTQKDIISEEYLGKLFRE